MASKGPVPKRIQERLGHITKAQKANVDTVRMQGAVRIPAADRAWHPIALRWYRSLRDSGQSVYYEPSDWAAAHYVAHAMTKNLEQGGKFSSMMFAAVWQAMSDLLTTESERRRVRMEIERGAVEEEQSGPTMLDEYREMMAEG